MASFTFDDGSGTQILITSYPAPANRFKDWTPIPFYDGERARALGDRRRYQFVVATAQRARGVLPGIAAGDEHIMRAFQLWAEGGGTFTVTTDDAESNTYSDVQLASDRDGNLIDLDIIYDPIWGEYSIGFEIESVASPQQHLRAVYLNTPTTVLTISAASYTWTFADPLLQHSQLDLTPLAYSWTFADVELTVT